MITQRIYDFPTFPIEKQLFYVPGAVTDGGFTSGGAQIIAPDIGGFGMLDIQPSLQVREWEYPVSSWLMSKTNGQVLRVRLAPTPQVSLSRNRFGGGGVTWDTGLLWSPSEMWEGDISAAYTVAALEGTDQITFDLTGIGAIVRDGHVIGHDSCCYMVNDIEYDGLIATATVNPPLRKNVAIGDPAVLRPWFLGRIANPQEIMTMYDAANAGHIQLGKITLREAIVS